MHVACVSEDYVAAYRKDSLELSPRFTRPSYCSVAEAGAGTVLRVRGLCMASVQLLRPSLA